MGVSGRAKLCVEHRNVWASDDFGYRPSGDSVTISYKRLKTAFVNWVNTLSRDWLLGIMAPLKSNFYSKPCMERSLWQVVSGKDLTQVTLRTQHSSSPIQIPPEASSWFKLEASHQFVKIFWDVLIKYCLQQGQPKINAKKNPINMKNMQLSASMPPGRTRNLPKSDYLQLLL